MPLFDDPIAPRKLSLNGKQRRALGILSGARNGATMPLMRVNGFRVETLTSLVLAGLATVETETVTAGGPTIKVERFHITDAGRQALK